MPTNRSLRSLSEEEQPFILHHEEEAGEKTPDIRLEKRNSISTRAICLHLGLVALYTAVFFYLRQSSPQPTIIPSPANIAIEYESQTFYPKTYDNPFTGDPRPELDSSWHELLKYSHIRVTKEELDAANYTSIAFKDGTGYIAQLAYTHQLHCIKQIRHYLHRNHYFPNASELELNAQGMHVDHCLETDDGLLYPFVKTRTYHQCVNWERLQDWTAGRAVNLFDPDLLQLPPGGKLLQTPIPSMVL